MIIEFKDLEGAWNSFLKQAKDVAGAEAKLDDEGVVKGLRHVFISGYIAGVHNTILNIQDGGGAKAVLADVMKAQQLL